MSGPLNPPLKVEYRTSPQQKLKSKQAAHTKKYGSPKLEHLLRQKCRIRAKEARSTSFASGRLVFRDKAYIEQILLEELAKLDYSLEDIVFQEILDEANKWFVEAYEEEENYLIDSTQTVFCPICQKLSLEYAEGLFSCSCGIKFVFPGSLTAFHHRIHAVIGEHESRCSKTLCFFVEPNTDQNVLYLSTLCDECEFFYTLR